MKTSTTTTATNNTNAMALPTDRIELKAFIEAKGLNDGAVTWCSLYNNGFEFKTEKQGFKLYNLDCLDLIGDKAEGRVSWCLLDKNGFQFETEMQGLKLYNLDGVDLIGDKADGLVLWCNLYKNGFAFETNKQGMKLYDFDGLDLIGAKADGLVLGCYLYKNGVGFRTKIQGWKYYNFDGVELETLETPEVVETTEVVEVVEVVETTVMAKPFKYTIFCNKTNEFFETNQEPLIHQLKTWEQTSDPNVKELKQTKTVYIDTRYDAKLRLFNYINYIKKGLEVPRYRPYSGTEIGKSIPIINF